MRKEGQLAQRTATKALACRRHVCQRTAQRSSFSWHGGPNTSTSAPTICFQHGGVTHWRHHSCLLLGVLLCAVIALAAGSCWQQAQLPVEQQQLGRLQADQARTRQLQHTGAQYLIACWLRRGAQVGLQAG